MTKNETRIITEVANDVKWIVKEMKERNVAVTKQLDSHDRRITNVSRRTWMFLGGIITIAAMYGVLIR